MRKNRKLTASMVRRLRIRWKKAGPPPAKETKADLAADMGISYRSAWRCANGQTYKDVA